MIGWSGCLDVFRVVLVESEIFVIIMRAAAAVLQILNFSEFFVFRPMFFKFRTSITCLHASICFIYYQDIFKSKKVTLVFVYEFLAFLVRDLM